MSSPGEDYDANAVIEACSIQDLACNKSLLQKNDDLRLYVEAVQAHRNAKIELINRYQIRQELLFNLNEKINLKTALDKTALKLNEESNAVNGEILKIYDSRSRDIDVYHSAVHKILEEIKNLPKLFDHGPLENKIEENKNKLLNFEDTFKTYEIQHNKYKEMVEKMTAPEEFETSNLDAVLKDSARVMNNLNRSMRKNEKNMILVKNNLDFLIEENSKLTLQIAEMITK